MVDRYCRGWCNNLAVTEVESKAYHDNDVYEVVCSECGATTSCLAKRPTEVIIKCKQQEEL